MRIFGNKFRLRTGKSIPSVFQVYYKSECICIRNEADETIYEIPIENIDMKEIIQEARNAEHKNRH